LARTLRFPRRERDFCRRRRRRRKPPRDRHFSAETEKWLDEIARKGRKSGFPACSLGGVGFRRLAGARARTWDPLIAITQQTAIGRGLRRRFLVSGILGEFLRAEKFTPKFPSVFKMLRFRLNTRFHKNASRNFFPRHQKAFGINTRRQREAEKRGPILVLASRASRVLFLEAAARPGRPARRP
jgi:hypothetical protein